MNVRENVSLIDYSTMRLGGRTNYLVEVTDIKQVLDAIDWAASRELPVLVVGSGSNLVFTDRQFPGLVIINKTRGIEFYDEANEVLVKSASGENWDNLVEATTKKELTGIEALSAIPGTVGAAPVQNIGAYGQELSDTLQELKAINIRSGKQKTFFAKDCRLSYRSSRFKRAEHGDWFIVSVTLKLKKGQMEPPYYRSLESYLSENKINDRSPTNIRKAVTSIRHTKLPDPSKVSNTGSFFKNPVISPVDFEKIKFKNPGIPNFSNSDGNVKIPAGWLIESIGYKGYRHVNGMGTYDNHALVLVNYQAKRYADLAEIVEEIQSNIMDKFNIMLEVEPEIV